MNTRTAATRLSSGLLACFAFACLPTYLSAQSPFSDRTEVKVSFADLNLSTEAGAEAAYGRISRAAARACGQRPYSLNVKAASSWLTCRDDAIATAVVSVGHPRLAAVHRGKTGEGTTPVFAGSPRARK